MVTSNILKALSALKPTTEMFGGYAFGLAASLLNQGGMFLANLVVARLLGASGFGQFSVVQTSALSLATILQLSMWLTATHFSAQGLAAGSERLGTVLALLLRVAIGMAILVAVILIVAGGWYADAVLLDSSLQSEVIAAAGYAAFAVIYSYQSGVLVGVHAFRSHAIASLIPSIFVVIAASVGSKFAGTTGALWGLSLAGFVRCIFTEAFLRRELNGINIILRIDGWRAQLPNVLRFALPASANTLTYSGALWLGGILIVRQFGFEAFALYSVCVGIKTIAMFLPLQVNGISVAVLSQSYVLHESGAFAKRLLLNIGLLMLLSATLLFGLSLFSKEILLIYGAKFLEAEALLLVLFLSGIFEAAAYGVTQAYSARGQLWTAFIYGSLPRDALFVIGIYVIVRDHELKHVGWVYVGGWLVYIFLLTLREVLRHVGRGSNYDR